MKSRSRLEAFVILWGAILITIQGCVRSPAVISSPEATLPNAPIPPTTSTSTATLIPTELPATATPPPKPTEVSARDTPLPIPTAISATDTRSPDEVEATKMPAAELTLTSTATATAADDVLSELLFI